MSVGKKPNILWISLEDTTPRFGCYGDPLARTPNIDQLAAEGTIFKNAFATSGVCAPSRSSIITGMYSTSIGAHQMRTTHSNDNTPELPTPYTVVPPPYVKAFTEYLRMDDYYCTNNAKTDYQFESPLTAWDECSRDAHWRNREEGQPFFSVFNLFGTHESFMWSNEDKPLVTDPDQVVLPPYIPDTPKSRLALARQYEHIAENDRLVGQLLEQLKSDDLYENTIVFIWSDHGEGLPRSKRWTYDGGIRVPLIVRLPGGHDQGIVSDQLVSMIDLGTTVLSLAGIDIPYHLQGQPFIGEQKEERDYVFASRDRNGESYDMVRAVRDKKYKYIRNYYPEKGYLQWNPFSQHHPMWQELWKLKLEDKLDKNTELFMQHTRPPEELYDCENDPYEIENLANHPKYQTELSRLRQELDHWCSKFDPWGNVSEEKIADHMWPDGHQPQAVTPLCIPINSERPGLQPMSNGSFDQPTGIMMYSATQGASIAYKLDHDPKTSWKIYKEPIILPTGITTIRAKAVRIGYKDSEEAVFTFTEISERESQFL